MYYLGIKIMIYKQIWTKRLVGLMFLQVEMKYETTVSYTIAFGYPQYFPWNQISDYYGHMITASQKP